MYRCQGCEKSFTRKNNMRRHQMKTCEGKKNVREIMNRVDQQAKPAPPSDDFPMEALIKPKPLDDKTPKSKMKDESDQRDVTELINRIVQRAEPIPPSKTQDDIPIEPLIKPKPMVDTSRSDMNNVSGVEEESDDEDETTSSEEDSHNIEVMPDNPDDLKKMFGDLFKKLHNNMNIYNKLVFLLDELKRMDCLTKEECNAINGILQEKVGIN